jgi:hypothetical protein
MLLFRDWLSSSLLGNIPTIIPAEVAMLGFAAAAWFLGLEARAQ